MNDNYYEIRVTVYFGLEDYIGYKYVVPAVSLKGFLSQLKDLEKQGATKYEITSFRECNFRRL